MDPITTVMRQCRLFDGIPEEKYQNVLACLRGETKSFRKDATPSPRSASARSGPAL